jgi:heme/copper-type cytochrome/quinol oxidase subunit 2
MRISFASGLFWASVACCLVAQLLIVRSVLGARHLPSPTADVPRSRGAVELLWAVVPAVALAVLLAFTWRAIQQHQAMLPVAELAR